MALSTAAHGRILDLSSRLSFCPLQVSALRNIPRHRLGSVPFRRVHPRASLLSGGSPTATPQQRAEGGRALAPATSAAPPAAGRQGAGPGRRVACAVLPTGTASKSTAPWSAQAIKAFSMGELEARKLKYTTTGAEALLLGILTEGTSPASKILRRHGMKLFDVRDEANAILGKGDMYYSPPEHPPLTEDAQKVLNWAVAERERAGAKEVTAEHMVLGMWAHEGSTGQQILAKLGFNEKTADELRAAVAGPAMAASAA